MLWACPQYFPTPPLYHQKDNNYQLYYFEPYQQHKNDIITFHNAAWLVGTKLIHHFGLVTKYKTELGDVGRLW